MAMKLDTRTKKVAIAGGAIGALLLLTGFAKAAPSPVAECPPFTKIDRSKLKAVVDDAIAGGMRGLDRVSAHAGLVMFPVDPATKQPISWPKNAPWVFPPGTTPHVICLYNELRKIVAELNVPEEPSEPDSPGKIFNDLIRSTPTPGGYFKVKSGWIAGGTGSKSLLYQALRHESEALAKSPSARLDYLACMTRSRWNRDRYGAPKRSTKWNDTYGFETEDGKYWLWPAFMPWHEDAIASIVNGLLPQRSITPAGDMIEPGSLGLLWLPPIDRESAIRGNVVNCNVEWDDGTSALEPPQDLLSLLEAS